jgi:orotate phosphoribosyltransferase
MALEPKILADLRRERLLQEGHFVFRSGLHGGVVVDRDRLLSDPIAAGHMGYALAKRFFVDHVETVASPSIWGAGLAQWVAHFLDPKAKIVYATPTDEGLKIAAPLEELIRGRRVLVVDNLVLSGETIRRFVPLIERLAGDVIGVATLWNSAEREIAGREVFGLLNSIYDFAPAERCRFCAAGDTPTPAPY